MSLTPDDSYGEDIAFTCAFDDLNDTCTVVGELLPVAVELIFDSSNDSIGVYRSTHPFICDSDIYVEMLNETVQYSNNVRLNTIYTGGGYMRIRGHITGLSNYAFTLSSLGSVYLKNIKLNNIITSLGSNWLNVNSAVKLENFDFYWTAPIRTYSTTYFPIGSQSATGSTTITIPNGSLQNYLDNGYPSGRLVERTV